MNSHHVQIAFVLGAIGGVAFVVFLVLVAGGCRQTLPEEPAYTETVSRIRRD